MIRNNQLQVFSRFSPDLNAKVEVQVVCEATVLVDGKPVLNGLIDLSNHRVANARTIAPGDEGATGLAPTLEYANIVVFNANQIIQSALKLETATVIDEPPQPPAERRDDKVARRKRNAS